MKLLEENSNLHDLGFDNEFLGMTTKVQATKEKNKLFFIEVKILYASKNTVKKVKQHPMK